MIPSYITGVPDGNETGSVDSVAALSLSPFPSFPSPPSHCHRPPDWSGHLLNIPPDRFSGLSNLSDVQLTVDVSPS